MSDAPTTKKRDFSEREQDIHVDTALQIPKQPRKSNVIYEYGRLTPGRLIRRYKRFLADVEFESDKDKAGQIVTVYCPNTGPMLGLLDVPKAPVLLSKSEDKKRKYQWTLEMIQVEEDGRELWIGVHSSLSNKMIENALGLKLLPEFSEFQTVQREVRYGKDKSRVDFVLSSVHDSGRKDQCYLEVKSVTLSMHIKVEDNRVANCATFPDTVSIRAQRHVKELIALSAEITQSDVRSRLAAIVFLVQRDDIDHFAPSSTHDPEFASLCSQAEKAGVQLVAYSRSVACDPIDGTYEVTLGRKLRIIHAPQKDSCENALP